MAAETTPYVEPPSRRTWLYGEQSDQVHHLMDALCKGQAILQAARKTHQSHYGMFASLEDVWQAYQKAFPPQGLVVTQATVLLDGTKRLLVTQLSHVSGQWMRSVEPLMCEDKDAQKRKSELTLVRRMALCSLLGIVDGDDDGEEQKEAIQRERAASEASHRIEVQAIAKFKACRTDDERRQAIERARELTDAGRLSQSAFERLQLLFTPDAESKKPKEEAVAVSQ